MKVIYKLFRKRKGAFFVTLVCCMGGALITLLWNGELAAAINRVRAGSSLGWDWFGKSLLLVIAAAVTQGGMFLGGAYTGEFAAHDLRMHLAEKVLKLPYVQLAEQSAGEQISSQQNEVEEINQYISDSFFPLCSMAINFFFTFFYLLKQNVPLTLLYMAPVLVTTIYTKLSSQVIYGYTKEEQEQNRKMNGVMGTVLMLFPIVRIYEAEGLIKRNFEENRKDWQEAAVNAERVKAGLMSLSGILSCLPLALLLLVGGTMVVHGSFSLGMLYVFINLSGNVSGVMMNLPGHLAAFRRFQGNLERVWKMAATR